MDDLSCLNTEFRCPDCQSVMFHIGPQGGMATNIKCGCGSKFWFCPPFPPQRINNSDEVYSASAVRLESWVRGDSPGIHVLIRRAIPLLSDELVATRNRILDLADHVETLYKATAASTTPDLQAQARVYRPLVEHLWALLGECLCRTTSCGHPSSLHPNGRCERCNKECWS